MIGPMGSGKTTVGARLASELSLTFKDTDQMIESQSGRSISDIFIEDGEEAFRALEKIILRSGLLEDETVLSLDRCTVCFTGIWFIYCLLEDFALPSLFPSGI